jgi:hypothetical protein
MYSCHTFNSLRKPKWKSALYYVRMFGSIRLGSFCHSTDDMKLWSKLPIVIYVGHLNHFKSSAHCACAASRVMQSF